MIYFILNIILNYFFNHDFSQTDHISSMYHKSTPSYTSNTMKDETNNLTINFLETEF